MPASHGSKAVLIIEGFNISNFLTTMGMNFERESAEVTRFGNGSKQYIPGLKDSTFPIGGPSFTEAADVLWDLYYRDAPAYFEYAPAGYIGGTFYSGYALITEFGISSGVDDPNDLVGDFQVTGDVERSSGLDFGSGPDTNQFYLDFNEIDDGLVYDGNEF